MELLPKVKSGYLLNSSLKSLHLECREWLNEIEFLKNEVAFFYKLIYIKEFQQDLPINQVINVENKLVYLYHDQLDKIKEELLNHEQYLAQFYKNHPQPDEENYRAKHRQLQKELKKISAHNRKIKEDIYTLVHKK